MRRIIFDMWQSKREAAETLPNGLRVLRETDSQGRATASMWMPKATKPCWDYYFRSTESREKQIAATIAAYDASQASKVANRKARVTGDLSLADPGTVFHYSWGYDQTNSEYFQVTSRSGLKAVIRAIGTETVPGSEGFMSCRLRPVKDAFLSPRCKRCNRYLTPEYEGGAVHEDGGEFPHAFVDMYTHTKRIQFYNGSPVLTMDCGHASVVKFTNFGNADALTLETSYSSWYA